MDDSYDPLVCIHVMSAWVQVTLSEALCEIARNIELETKPLKNAIDVFEDLMHYNVPYIDGYYPGMHVAREGTVTTVNSGTTREEFVADAVLARLGLDAATGPMLLGADRWITVRNRFQTVFAGDTKDEAAATARTAASDSAEQAPRRTRPAPRIPWFKWRSKFCIQEPINDDSTEGRVMDKHEETPDEAEIWVARVAPAHPAVTKFSTETPTDFPRRPASAGSTKSSSLDRPTTHRGKPGTDRSRAKRRSEQLHSVRRETKGTLGRKI